jgi:hypothetical protein
MAVTLTDRFKAVVIRESHATDLLSWALAERLPALARRP